MEEEMIEFVCKKEYSVKILIYEEDYEKLKEIADYNSITIKKMINKSISKALGDIEEDGFYRRKKKIWIDNGILKKASFKIKEKHYLKLQKISESHDIRIKDLVKDIILFYPFKFFNNKDRRVVYDEWI